MASHHPPTRGKHPCISLQVSHCSMSRWSSTTMRGIVMTGGSNMLIIILFDQRGNGISFNFFNSQFFSPSQCFSHDCCIILPFVLLFFLIFPSNLQLEFSSKPPGIHKLLNNP